MRSLLQKLVVASLVVVGYAVGSSLYFQGDQVAKTEQAVRQMDDDVGAAVQQEQMRRHSRDNNLYLLGWAGVAVVCATLVAEDAVRFCKRTNRSSAPVTAV